MAEGKNSFVLYADYIKIFEKLTDEEAGQLIKHLFRYVNDKDPETDNRLLEIVFEPIKQQLKRDLKSWDEKKESRSTSGKLGNLKRWNEDLYKKVIAEEMTIEEADEIVQNRKSSQNIALRQNSSQNIANVADTVTVDDNVSKEDIPPLPPTGGESEKKLSWKKDYEVYLEELRIAYRKISKDSAWIAKQLDYNPGIDVMKSIEKACTNYWATEGGWKKKVRSRSTSIDWKSTFANAIANKINKVYSNSPSNGVEVKKATKPKKW